MSATPFAEDNAVEQFYNFGIKKLIQRHPKFFIQSCQAYRQLAIDRRAPHGAVRLYLILTEFSLVNIPSSDQSGGLICGIRKLAGLMGANGNTVIEWRNWLVKNGYILVKNLPSKSRYGKFKYFVRAILTDERLAELEGRATVTTSGNGDVTRSGNDAVTRNGNGDVTKSGAEAVTISGALPVTTNGNPLNIGYREEGRGAGVVPPGPASHPTDRVPVFEPIPASTFESTLKLMLQECQREIRAARKRHVAITRVFLRQASVEWLEQSASRMGRTPEGARRKADYLAQAEALKKSPENWKPTEIVTPLGEQICAAWKARADEIGRMLAGAH